MKGSTSLIACGDSFTSFCRFVFEKVKKHSPRCVSDTFVNAAKIVFLHIVNRKVFNAYSIKSVYKFAGFLMRKVVSFIRNSFMHTSNYLASFRPGFGSLLLGRKFALDFDKIFFFFPEKARVLNMFAIGKGCEMFQAHIQANRWFDWLRGRNMLNSTGKEYKPFSGKRAPDSASFNRAFDRSMEFNLNAADFGKSDNIFKKLETGLRISEAIIPELAPKSWIARLFAGLYPSKESSKSQINSGGNILKRLAESIVEKRVLFFKAGNRIALIISRNAFLLGFPHCFTLLKKIIIEPVTSSERTLKLF